jgi:acetyltransferase-like isoleucine patch superfamily enzyme
MKFNNKNITISENAHIGKNVKIGDNSVVYDNVIIGDNSIIANDCIIGEPTNDYYSELNYINPILSIGENALIRSHTIIYSGSKIGNGFSTGHRVTIREKTIIGDNCRFGTLCDIQGNCEIGNYVWLHSNVHIGQNSKIDNFVFIYPYVIFTNDPHPPSEEIIGPKVGEFTQIAVNSVILPGVEIGKNCLIGANSLVSKNFEDYSLVVGSPAKYIKDIREVKNKVGETLYPWPLRFKRGMPWENLGFEQWIKNNDTIS